MQLRWQIRRLHRRISIHLTSIDQEVRIAVQLAIYHVHTFFSVLFFAVYLIINALLYQKWARLSMTQAIEERQYKDAARRSFLHAASTTCILSLSCSVSLRWQIPAQSTAILCSVSTMRSTCGLTVASTRCSFGLWISFVVTPIETMSSCGFLRKCQPHSRPA